MANILQRMAINDQLISADGISTFDVGLNPLSVIMLMLRPLNDNAALTGFARYRAIAAAVNRISVLHHGASVFSMRGEDVASYNYLRHGIQPMEGNSDDADNERRAVCLPIVMGRRPYDPKSCFPASQRGEMQLEIDLDIADTGYDGLRLSAETIELLGVTPTEFERKVTTFQTLAATGDNDIFLPQGNLVRGLMAFGTTGFGGAAPAPSLGRMAVYLDGRQVGFTGHDFECALAMHSLRGIQPPRYDIHTHRVDATAAVTTQETTGPIEEGNDWQNTCYLDFDPTGDDMYSIDTGQAQSWMLRVNAETADAVRVIQVERVKL